MQPVDRNVAKRVSSCWVAFAKANVIAKSLDCGDGFTWPVFTEAGDDVARLAAKFEVVKSKSLPNGPRPTTSTGNSVPE